LAGGNASKPGDAWRGPGGRFLLSLTAAGDRGSALSGETVAGLVEQRACALSGAPRRARENPGARRRPPRVHMCARRRLVLTPDRTHHRSRSPRCAAASGWKNGGQGSRQIGFETLGKELALWVERAGLSEEVRWLERWWACALCARARASLRLRMGADSGRAGAVARAAATAGPAGAQSTTDKELLRTSWRVLGIPSALPYISSKSVD
jgi:hypothetical protein